jgi:uncharacterized membrane protein (UPF0127 family)
VSQPANLRSASLMARRAANLVVIAAIAAGLGVALSMREAMRAQQRATVIGPDGASLHLEIADTPELRMRGLSGRTTLDSDGMMLVFDVTAQHGIWMRAMRFQLDLLWVDAGGRILAVQERAEPCATDSCPIFTGENEVTRYVLELPGGYASRAKWRVGEYLLIQVPGERSVGPVRNVLWQRA